MFEIFFGNIIRIFSEGVMIFGTDFFEFIRSSVEEFDKFTLVTFGETVGVKEGSIDVEKEDRFHDLIIQGEFYKR